MLEESNNVVPLFNETPAWLDRFPPSPLAEITRSDIDEWQEVKRNETQARNDAEHVILICEYSVTAIDDNGWYPNDDRDGGTSRTNSRVCSCTAGVPCFDVIASKIERANRFAR